MNTDNFNGTSDSPNQKPEILKSSEVAQISSSYSFRNPDLSLEERVNEVISLLTLDEKIDFLSTKLGVPRLEIPYNDNGEGIHGLVMTGFLAGGNIEIPTTTFPQPISMAQSWDSELMQQVGAVIGAEARFISNNPQYGHNKLLVMAPNSDLGRDPRWGRTDECYGEDAFLNGTLTVSVVKGLQGDHPTYLQVAALLKHFLANSNEDERLYSSSNFDERLFHEYYSVPFRMGIIEGGATSFMAAYNAYNGIPCTVHPMLKEITIEKWGLDGIICTDFRGMSNLVDKHKTHRDKAHAAAASLKAGISQFLEFSDYKEAIKEAITQNLLSETEIDRALRGNFRVMIRLGLLDSPGKGPYTLNSSGEAPWLSEKHRSIARLVTRKSIVLLKNEPGNNSRKLLPLDKKAGLLVAIVGPLADRVMSDLYAPLLPYVVTPLEGLKNKLGSDANLRYQSRTADSKAQKFQEYDPARDNPTAIELARSADVAIVCVGNTPWCGGWEMGHATPGFPGEGMEALDRQTLTLEQEDLVKEIYAANPNTIVVLITSFPYAINWTQENVPAILQMGHGSQELGNALADVIFGDYNPAGRLVQTWPSSLEQLPPMLDYDIRNGRTYMYFRGEPLFPFGFGLSYTTFSYANLQMSSGSPGPKETISIKVDITNTGERAGEEVVQLYVKHINSRVERPLKELKGFSRVNVEPGETRTVTMTLAASELAYWDISEQRFVVENEEFEIRVGSSSEDIRLHATLKVGLSPVERGATNQ